MLALLFSAWALAVLIVGIPILWLFIVLGGRERSHRIVQRWARVVLWLGGCAPQTSGLEHLRQDVVMVANHSSFLDSLVLVAAIPGDYLFVVNHKAATRPLLGAIIRNAGHIVVDRGSAASKAACARRMIDALRSGQSLLLFSEGTRSSDGTLLPSFLSGRAESLCAPNPAWPGAADRRRVAVGQLRGRHLSRRREPARRRCLDRAPVRSETLRDERRRTSPAFQEQRVGSADVYLANVLVPSDSRIAVTAQDHTTEQRALVVDFVKTDGLGNTTCWLGLGGVGMALVSWRRARR